MHVENEQRRANRRIIGFYFKKMKLMEKIKFITLERFPEIKIYIYTFKRSPVYQR